MLLDVWRRAPCVLGCFGHWEEETRAEHYDRRHGRGQPTGQFAAQTGEGVYSTLRQGRHMPDAKGASGAGAYPSLAANKRLISSAYPAIIVMRGRKAMPPFGPNLSDGQIAGVVNYRRTHFANAYKDPITRGTVKALRESGSKPSGQTTQAGLGKVRLRSQGAIHHCARFSTGVACNGRDDAKGTGKVC